jgi:DNA-binding transcriptional LysR family regulator
LSLNGIKDLPRQYRLMFAGVRLASFIVRDDIAANRLVPVLEEFNPGDIDELHAVYLGQGRLLPVRIRVFLEFLAERITINAA